MGKQRMVMERNKGKTWKRREDLTFPTSPSPAKTLLIGGSVTWWLPYRVLSVWKDTIADLSLAFS